MELVKKISDDACQLLSLLKLLLSINALKSERCTKCLKIAKVIPTFKKGDKRKPETYRPIGLLRSISKVFEKLLQSRMIKFCEKKSIICGSQYGLRSKRSCIDVIVSITEFMKKEIDTKSLGQACFIDLLKAFDTLDHNTLLKKWKIMDIKVRFMI